LKLGDETLDDNLITWIEEKKGTTGGTEEDQKPADAHLNENNPENQEIKEEVENDEGEKETMKQLKEKEKIINREVINSMMERDPNI
jgi:hypothetical protein